MKPALRLSIIAALTVAPLPAAAKVTIGTGVDPAFSVAYVAQAAGLFEKHQVDAAIRTGPSGSGMIPYVIGNDLQAALGSEVAGIGASNVSNGKVVMVAEVSYMIGWHGLVTRADITSLDALKGKKVGVSRGSGGEQFWLRLLDIRHEQPTSFQVVNVDAPEMIAAVGRGDIDGYAVWEPWVSRGVLALKSKVHVLQDSVGLYNQKSMLFMNPDWIAANRDEAGRFLAALADANDFIAAKPAEATDMVARFLKMEHGLAETLLKKYHPRLHLDQDSIDGAVIAADQLRAIGKLPKPVDWSGFIYPDLLRELKPANVDYKLPGS